jgi:hypothetical protein
MDSGERTYSLAEALARCGVQLSQAEEAAYEAAHGERLRTLVSRRRRSSRAGRVLRSLVAVCALPICSDQCGMSSIPCSACCPA